MVKNNFFYLLLFVFAFCSCKAKKMVTTNNNSNMEVFDWQGHRGCRGLLPENTIEAFLKALSFNEIVTLELDLSVSKDNQLVVSHEPWMSDEICSHPDGSPVFLPDNFAGYLITALPSPEKPSFNLMTAFLISGCISFNAETACTISS